MAHRVHRAGGLPDKRNEHLAVARIIGGQLLITVERNCRRSRVQGEGEWYRGEDGKECRNEKLTREMGKSTKRACVREKGGGGGRETGRAPV